MDTFYLLHFPQYHKPSPENRRIFMINNDHQFLSGTIPYAIGTSTIIRIPIPNTPNLFIEFKPKGRIPTSGSTSVLFFQDPTGKKNLRLDYGYNKTTNSINYHWNQRSTFEIFKVQDHQVVGKSGQFTYKAAKVFKYVGKPLILVSAAIDGYSIVKSSTPAKEATKVVSSWALAWAGCKVLGTGGTYVGSVGGPIGMAAGGVGGCIIGGIAGGFACREAGAKVYDLSKNYFSSLEEAKQRP